MSRSPRFRHQELVGNIFSTIREYLRKHPVGRVVISPSDVELGDADVYQPDIYFISQERLENVLTEQGASGAPDLVIEVLSPSTARLDRGPKSEVYGATGVKEMWVVDGRNNKIDSYLSRDGALVLIRTVQAGDTIETTLIPGLKLDVREIFES